MMPYYHSYQPDPSFDSDPLYTPVALGKALLASVVQRIHLCSAGIV